MKGSAEVAQQPGAVRTQAVAGDSPTDVSTPFWITACVRLLPPRRRNGAEITASLANAVFPAVQALIADRLRTESDVEAPLNRDRIARRCGLGDATKAGWLFDYLELIGFLHIQRHYAGVGRGRRADTFTVFTRPAANYIGPRTHAELERALDDPDRYSTSVLFIDKTAGQAIDAGSGVYRSDQDAQSGSWIDKTAGQAIDAGSGVYRSDQDAQSGSWIDKTAGQAIDAGSGVIIQIDRSSISEREIEGSIEPAPGEAAKPPATGLDESLHAEVRNVVRKLPWTTWAKGRNRNFRLSPTDADDVQAAICLAITTAGISLEQASEIGQAALSEAKTRPIKYVIDAFGPAHLARRLRALDVEPLDDNPLPLLVDADLEVVAPGRVGRSSVSKTKPEALVKPELPECHTCGAHKGEGLGYRQVDGKDGRARRCPDCVPTEAA